MSREAGLTDSKLTSHQVTIACHNELLSPFALDRLDVAFLTDHEEFHKVKIQLQEVEASRLISEISLISSFFAADILLPVRDFCQTSTRNSTVPAF